MHAQRRKPMRNRLVRKKKANPLLEIYNNTPLSMDTRYFKKMGVVEN